MRVAALVLLLAALLSGCEAEQVQEASVRAAEANPVVHDLQLLGAEMWNIAPNSNFEVRADDSIHAGPGTQVPHVYEGVQKWGMAETKPIQSEKPFQGIKLEIDKVMHQADDQIMIEFSTSDDGEAWSDMQQLGEGVHEFSLLSPARYLKLRVTLLLKDAKNSSYLRRLGVQLTAKQIT